MDIGDSSDSDDMGIGRPWTMGLASRPSNGAVWQSRRGSDEGSSPAPTPMPRLNAHSFSDHRIVELVGSEASEASASVTVEQTVTLRKPSQAPQASAAEHSSAKSPHRIPITAPKLVWSESVRVVFLNLIYEHSAHFIDKYHLDTKWDLVCKAMRIAYPDNHVPSGSTLKLCYQQYGEQRLKERLRCEPLQPEPSETDDPFPGEPLEPRKLGPLEVYRPKIFLKYNLESINLVFRLMFEDNTASVWAKKLRYKVHNAVSIYAGLKRWILHKMWRRLVGNIVDSYPELFTACSRSSVVRDDCAGDEDELHPMTEVERNENEREEHERHEEHVASLPAKEPSTSRKRKRSKPVQQPSNNPSKQQEEDRKRAMDELAKEPYAEIMCNPANCVLAMSLFKDPKAVEDFWYCPETYRHGYFAGMLARAAGGRN